LAAIDEKWVMVRIKRHTHAALVALANRWQQLAEEGARVPHNPDRSRPSFDEVIAELLARDHAHRARARKRGRSGWTAGTAIDPDGSKAGEQENGDS